MKDRLQNEENLIKKYQSNIEQLQREMNVVEQLDLKSGDRFNDNEKLEKFNDLYYCYNLLCQELNRLQTALDEANERLARSVELPLDIKVGQTVWFIRQLAYSQPYKPKIEETYIEKIIFTKTTIKVKLGANSFYETSIKSYNKTWFTDKNKALEVLKNERS